MHTSFTKDKWQAFREMDRAGPIHMLNLIRLRQTATGPDGRTVSGAEAYASYSRLSAPVFAGLGGRIVWRGALEQMLIGPENELWDICFIAEYPSVDAFAAMMRSGPPPEHAAAALRRALLRHRSGTVRTGRFFQAVLAPFLARFGSLALKRRVQARYFEG